MAKGYTQKKGIDYDETFSPIAMLKSIRILLSIATYYDYEIWQMNVVGTIFASKAKGLTKLVILFNHWFMPHKVQRGRLSF